MVVKTNAKRVPLIDFLRPRSKVTYRVTKSIRDQGAYKGFFQMWFGVTPMMIAVDPEAAKFVLKCPQLRKIGVISVSKKNKRFVAQNLLSADSDDWRRHRSNVYPAFSTEALNNYYPISKELVELSISKIPVDQDFETTSFLSKLTLDVLGKTVFGYNFGRLEGKNDVYYNAYLEINKFLMSRSAALLLLFPFLEDFPIQIPTIKSFHAHHDKLTELFTTMIEEHKGKSNDRSLLGFLLQGYHSNTDKDNRINHEELLSNIYIMFLAGHDTTTYVLTWAVTCLSAYPDIQEKLFNEISEQIGNKDPTLEELEKLEYLDCFIQEVLRIHTSVPILSTREATEDISYDDQILPKGSLVGICFQAIHTHPEHWPNPEVFDPNRFLPENKKGRHHFAHIPFSAGTRQCIGNVFSLIEQRLFITKLLQKYRIVPPVIEKPLGLNEFLSVGQPLDAFVRFKRR